MSDASKAERKHVLVLLNILNLHSVQCLTHEDPQRVCLAHDEKALLVVAKQRVQAAIAQDLARREGGILCITQAGRAYLKRHGGPEQDFAGQHRTTQRRVLRGQGGVESVTLNLSESPLAWLHQRRGKNGRALIDETQLVAGERLRADFTMANMQPRVSSNWDFSRSSQRGGAGEQIYFSEKILAARQRVDAALQAAGHELSGLLVDVCCFLKGLETIELERLWPPRTAKVVLCLGLDALARHYGLRSHAQGPQRGTMQAWGDEGYRPDFVV